MNPTSGVSKTLAVAEVPELIPSSQTEVWELFPKAHLKGFYQIKAKVALKVLYIEQLGLPT